MSDNPLEELVSLLDKASDLAKEVGTPINEVYSDLQKAENSITSLENFIGDMNDVVTIAADVGDLCLALTEIPVVGEILDTLGTVIRKVGTTTEEIMDPVNAFKKDVLDEINSVVKKINNVLSKITGTLNFFINSLPRWANTIQVLHFGWEIVHVLAKLLDGSEPAKRLEDLMNKFSDIGSQVKTVYQAVSDGLKSVWDVVKVVLKPVYETIKKFFEWFESIASEAEKVLGVFGEAKDIVDKVEDAIKPIKWALEAVKCIFDKIVNPVLDWIMKELGLDKFVHEIEDKLDDALHINDLLKELEAAFDLKSLPGAGDKLSSNSGKVSQAHKLDEVLKDFVSDPQQALMAAIVTAISGTPVLPGAFPPRPPKAPPLDYGGKNISLQLAVGPPQALSIVGGPIPFFKGKRIKISATGPLITLTAFPVVPPPSALTMSPTDWSDVDRFVKSVNSICHSLSPVLTLGGQLQQFLQKAHAQLVIPGQLHAKLSALQTETQFLYDFCQFLQIFPVFKILAPLNSGLEGELTSIKDLDANMNQFVDNASSLSTSLQPIMNAESPTLFATIKQLESSLKNWKSQAQKYQSQIQHGYKMDDKSGKKHTAQLDALATTYHQRLGELQSLLGQIKERAEAASSTSHAIAQALSTVSGDFDKVDAYAAKLEDDITKVAQLASWAGKLDGIFAPLKCMLTTYKCVGDDNHIKSTMMKSFQFIMELSADPTIQQDFKKVFEKLINEFFPVQSVDDLVKTALTDLQASSSTISKSSSTYLSTLTAIEKLQVGKYQYQYNNKKTGKIEVIDSHFFSEKQVQMALKLGQELSQAVGGL